MCLTLHPALEVVLRLKTLLELVKIVEQHLSWLEDLTKRGAPPSSVTPLHGNNIKGYTGYVYFAGTAGYPESYQRVWRVLQFRSAGNDLPFVFKR
jgi:hypothetical protein